MKYSNGSETVEIATVIPHGNTPRILTKSIAIHRDLNRCLIHRRDPTPEKSEPVWVVPCRGSDVVTSPGDVILRHEDGSYTVMGEIQFNEIWDIAE